MKEIRIDKTSENQRFDKFLKKYFKEASSGFLYKMLRKKNITLNGRKSEGKEILKDGDVIKVFFSDETFLKMKGELKDEALDGYLLKDDQNLVILYEDEDIIAMNKPKNLLSQKSSPKDVSLNEWMLSYLVRKGDCTKESLHIFRPSVMNRLDRNTTGIVLGAKTLKGAHYLSDVIKDKESPKVYRAICKGKIEEEVLYKDYLVKDDKENKVMVSHDKIQNSKEIITGIRPLRSNGVVTLVEVKLYTGRTHQIRAHLSFYHHPVIGDIKYGDSTVNKDFKNRYNISSQMLHSYEVSLPGIGEIMADMPKEFERVFQ
ncbi:MAG: RluA family pseudouridine synthase [Lachnospiraceae bacterium]|nr:RluA family pseudouridine synthase [Lachnospiraceae bacterium]